MNLIFFLSLLSYLGLTVAFSELEDFDDLGFMRTHQIRTQPMLPIDPYAPSVELTICNTPGEQEQSRLLITDLMTNEVAAAKIESFTIEYFCVIGDGRECECGSLLDPLVGLINRGKGYLKALKRVKWSSGSGMHPPLLSSLEKHFPNLELDLESRWNDPSALRSSPLLHSLHVYFEPSSLDTVKTSPLLTHVQTQIMDSHNLVELAIEIGPLGCVIYDIDPKFARLKGNRFPLLEKLTLVAFPLTFENVNYWMENMDWSHVENLDFRAIDQPTYFFNESMRLAGGLPQLKVLRVELPWFDKTRDLQEFEDTFRRFLDVPRGAELSEIVLQGQYKPYLQTILDGHGKTLKKLQLHDPERPYEPQREVLSKAELSDLGRRAPNLEEISIDINYTLNGSLPIEFLDTLQSDTAFPSLKTVELFGILGVSDPPASRRSRLPTNQHALLSKLTSRASINRAQIRVGEDRRLTGGYPADWVLWEQSNQELWMAERDASGKVMMTVPGRWDRATLFHDDGDL